MANMLLAMLNIGRVATVTGLGHPDFQRYNGRLCRVNEFDEAAKRYEIIINSKVVINVRPIDLAVVVPKDLFGYISH